MIIRELVTKLGFDLNEVQLARYESKVTGLKAELKKLDVTAKQTFQGLASAGRSATLAITAPIVATSVAMAKLAGDALETESRFKQVFRGNTDEVRKFAKELNISTGASVVSLKDSLSNFQSIFVGFEFSDNKAAGLSKTIQALAIDFAAVTNKSDEEASAAFRSALAGESEPVSRFGIDVRAEAVETELGRMGLEASFQKATAQQKILARINIIQRSLEKQGAIGQASRELGGFNRQLEALTSDMKDTAAEIGMLLLPAFQKMISTVRSGIAWFRGLSEEKQKLIGKIALVAAAIGPLLVVFGTLGLAIIGIVNSAPLIAAGFASIASAAGLITAPMVAGAAAALLFLNDIWAWVNGGKSAIGMLYGDFQSFKVGVLNVFEGIKAAFGGWVDVMLLPFRIALAAITGGLDGIKEEFSGFIDRMTARIDKLKAAANSVIGGAKKVFEAPAKITNGIGERIGGFAFDLFNGGDDNDGGAGEALLNGARALSGIGTSDFIPSIDAGPAIFDRAPPPRTQKTVNVNANINMQVPEGTPDAQMQSLRKAAQDAVRGELNTAIGEAMNEYPETE